MVRDRSSDLPEPIEPALIMEELANAAWPSAMPPGLRYGDFSGIDRTSTVCPSWNAIRRREVVRAGCVVAVIDSDESDRVFLVSWSVLPTAEAADAFFDLSYARECAEARAAYAELPYEMRVGALVGPTPRRESGARR